MVNSAQRYMFDTQESILNARRSGRCTKRIAECMLVNGHYQTAAKQLGLLKKSLFYRAWALEAEQMLGNEAKINAHPVYGKLRRLRYKESFLYSYEEMDKMLGILFQNNPENKMALDYFMGQMLLKGNVQGFVQFMGWVQQYGGYRQMPLGYQDAMRCIQSQGRAEELFVCQLRQANDRKEATMRKVLLSLWLCVSVWLLLACSSNPEHPTLVDKLPVIYPDYIGVTIPADIAPLNFNFADETINRMDVVVKGSKGGELHVNGEWADFDIDEWHVLTAQNLGGRLTVTVCTEKDGQWTQYKDFDIFVSEARLDDWGLTYRRIKPGYEVGGDIGIYQRELSSFDEYAIITETVVPGRCFNCHTANRTNPNRLTMQMRGEGGGTMIQKDGHQMWVETKTDSTKAAGSYSYWHPQGDYVALAVNSVHQAFYWHRTTHRGLSYV